MKLKIAFLQLLPGAAIEDNIEKGIKGEYEENTKNILENIPPENNQNIE